MSSRCSFTAARLGTSRRLHWRGWRGSTSGLLTGPYGVPDQQGDSSMMFLLWWGMVSACLQATTMSEFLTPKSYPKIPHWAWLGGYLRTPVDRWKKTIRVSHSHRAPKNAAAILQLGSIWLLWPALFWTCYPEQQTIKCESRAPLSGTDSLRMDRLHFYGAHSFVICVVFWLTKHN